MAPQTESFSTTRYRVIQTGKRFMIETNGERGEMEYITKEAAFEAIQQAVHAAMAENDAIEIFIPGGPGRWPLE
jgi:hypothetical protein